MENTTTLDEILQSKNIILASLSGYHERPEFPMRILKDLEYINIWNRYFCEYMKWRNIHWKNIQL